MHGGENKAIYLYPAEHYDFWQNELPATDMPWGMFCENFTSPGLRESSVFIGDRFSRWRHIEVKVTEPRMPCLKAGEVTSGDEIEPVSRETRQGNSVRYYESLR